MKISARSARWKRSRGNFQPYRTKKSPECWDLVWAFDYSIHGIVEILPMEPILIPATQTDKSPSGHPSKNVTNLSAVGTLNIYNSLGSGFLCSLLLYSSSICSLFSCLCLEEVGAGGRWERGRGIWDEVVGTSLRISQILYWIWVVSGGFLACGFPFRRRNMA